MIIANSLDCGETKLLLPICPPSPPSLYAPNLIESYLAAYLYNTAVIGNVFWHSSFVTALEKDGSVVINIQHCDVNSCSASPSFPRWAIICENKNTGSGSSPNVQKKSSAGFTDCVMINHGKF